MRSRAKGIDIDAIEDMMNRRMRTIWVRHTWFVILLVIALLIGLTSLTVFLTTKPTVSAYRGRTGRQRRCKIRAGAAANG